MEPVFALLEKLVSYDTRTNENSPGKEVKLLIENELIPRFQQYQFETKIFESEGHYSLFASKSGTGPPLLFSGHLDVVPWDDRWNTDPLTVNYTNEDDQEVIKGRGVSDMKCGIAALMIALPKIAQCPLPIQFALTGDEEIGGEHGTKIIVDFLVENGRLPNYVITADAAGMEIITRRRNVFDVFTEIPKKQMRIKGIKASKMFYSKIKSSQTSHAAYFRKEEDTHCIKQASTFLADNGYLPINIKGKFVKINVIPDQVTLEYVIPDIDHKEVEYDQGLNSLMQFASNVMDISFQTVASSDYNINSTSNVIHEQESVWKLETDIRAMLDELAVPLDDAIKQIRLAISSDLRIELKKSIGYIATPDNSPLVAAATSVLKQLGYNDKSAERGGATDGRFFAQHQIDTIDIGAIGWNVHGPNETSTTQSIRDLVRFFELIANKIAEIV